MEQFEDFIKNSGVRLTEPRRELFSILYKHEQPLTVGEIIKQSQIAERTSVYRSLELFTKLGLINKIHLKGRERYELLEPFKPHHHHLVCVLCGELLPLDNPKLEKIIRHLADSHNYEPVSHHVELQGICKECRAKR